MSHLLPHHMPTAAWVRQALPTGNPQSKQATQPSLSCPVTDGRVQNRPPERSDSRTIKGPNCLPSVQWLTGVGEGGECPTFGLSLREICLVNSQPPISWTGQINGSRVQVNRVSLNLTQLGVMKAIQFKKRPSRNTITTTLQCAKLRCLGHEIRGRSQRREERP